MMQAQASKRVNGKIVDPARVIFTPHPKKK